MKNLSWLATRSLILDYKFFQISDWSFFKKIEFIFKKYQILLTHSLKKFRLGRDFANLSGQKFYYGNKFGIADYQGILSRHRKLLAIAEFNTSKNGIFIDVGANVGIFSKFIRCLYPKISIYSIEPVPDVFKCLKKNFKQDVNTHIFNTALDKVKGKKKMLFSNQNSEISKIDKKGNITVNTETLDAFIKKNKITNIDLLKIDTEGFEDRVLLGAKNALSKTRFLFIEVTLENNPNYTLSSLMSCLHSKNYNFNLVAFRNFGDTSEGKAPIIDCLMKNVMKH